MQQTRRRPPVNLLIVGGPAFVVGLIGAVAGMLLGLLAPELTIGLYALDGPDPPSTFRPSIWGAQQGFLAGLTFGAIGGIFVCVLSYFGLRKYQITIWRLIVVMGGIGLVMGSINLVMSRRIDPIRITALTLILVALIAARCRIWRWGQT